MKKNILFLMILLNVISFSAAATDTLDISQTSGGSNNDFYYSAHSWAAQTFVPNQATLTQVSLKMKCISSAICNQSYETMDVEVRDDDGHRLGEIEDFPLSELSSSYAWESLAFDDIIETTPGETYAIYVFYNGYQLSSYPVLYWERATSDVYRAGSSSHREGSLTTTSAYDFTFKTYYDPDACLDDSDRCIDTTSWGHQNVDCDWEDVHECDDGEICEDAECVAAVNGNLADSDSYDSGHHHATSFDSGDQIGFYVEVENTGVEDGTITVHYQVMQGSTAVVDDDYDFDIDGGDSTTNTRFYSGTETSSWSGSYTYTLSVSPCSDGNTCSASGAFSVSIPVIDNDGDGYDSRSDCNDGDASVHPGASETTINGVDNDCDGLIDEDVPVATYYEDADGDGYGNAAMAVFAVSQPAGYVMDNRDCDDRDSSIHPGASETVANGVDNDCDGEVDEDCESEPTGDSCDTDSDCGSGEHCVDDVCGDEYPDALVAEVLYVANAVREAEAHGIEVPQDVKAVIDSGCEIEQGAQELFEAVYLIGSTARAFINMVDQARIDFGLVESGFKYIGDTESGIMWATRYSTYGSWIDDVIKASPRLKTVFNSATALSKSMPLINVGVSIVYGLKEAEGSDLIDYAMNAVMYTAGSFLVGEAYGMISLTTDIAMVIVPPTDTLLYPTLQSIHDAVESASYDFQTGFASSACGHSPYDALVCLWDSGTGMIDLLGYLFGQPFLDITGIEVEPAGALPARVNITVQNAWTLPSLSDQIYVGATVEQEASGYSCNLPYEKLTVEPSGEAQVKMTLPLNLVDDEEYTFIFRSWKYCMDIASCLVQDNGCYADGCCEDAITGTTRTLTGAEIADVIAEITASSPADSDDADDADVVVGSEEVGETADATTVASGCALHSSNHVTPQPAFSFLHLLAIFLGVVIVAHKVQKRVNNQKRNLFS